MWGRWRRAVRSFPLDGRRAQRLATATAMLLGAACDGSGGGHDDGSTRATPAPAATPAPPRAPNHRFVVLGFDGLDPGLVTRWIEHLPNLRRVRDEGAFVPLRTTNPPQSPVAWATFATGLSPGEHGIFDFVNRDPQTYRPAVGTTEHWDTSWSPDGALLRPAGGRNLRRGRSFWAVAAEAGIHAEALFVPFAWPPEPMAHGAHVSGLGLPDLRGTNSTATVWSTRFGLDAPDAGGVRAVPIALIGGVASSTVEGPLRNDGRRSTVSVRFEHVSEGGGDAVDISVGAERVRVVEGGWSPFLTMAFPVGGERTVAGIARFLAVDVGPKDLVVYQDPVGSDPQAPHLPLTEPASFARTLAEDAGPWKTVGWEEDTSTLNAELISDEQFIAECHRLMDQREQQARAAWRRNPALLVAVWTGPDRLSHMFFRDLDPEHRRHDAKQAAARQVMLDAYRKVDTIVGGWMADLPADTTLVVLSDHGFGAFRQGLHVNRLLADAGFLRFTPGTGPTPRAFLQDVDWSQTQAYSVGTGQIYLNLRGREGQGTVLPSDADAVLSKIEAALGAVRGPDGGAVVVATSRGDVVHAGAARGEAPDLQLAFAPGWQTSWETRLGGAPQGLFATNDRLWSGDHAASDPKACPGVLGLWPRRELAADPGIEDLAPTLLSGLGVPSAAGAGRVIFSP